MTAPTKAPSIPPAVAWLAERAGVGDDARAIVEHAADGGALVHALAASGHGPLAALALAAALPPREGIWWAWVSARHAARLGGGDPSPDIAEALGAAERWVAQPDDAHRRAAWAASAKAGLDTPAGCAAAAVFFTSGSVASSDAMMVPPPPGLYGTLIGAAVALSASADAANMDALFGAFIAQGEEVVRRLGGWDASVVAARQHYDAQRERHDRASAPPAAPASASR